MSSELSPYKSVDSDECLGSIKGSYEYTVIAKRIL